MKLLSEDEIVNRLGEIPGWIFSENKLVKEFVRIDFSDALTFIIKVGIEAEKLDHHPDMHLHSYNKVTIVISTHSSGGVTANDFSLAKQIEKIR